MPALWHGVDARRNSRLTATLAAAAAACPGSGASSTVQAGASRAARL